MVLNKNIKGIKHMYNEGQLRNRSITLLTNGETYDTLAQKVGVSRSTVNVFVRGGKVSEGTLAKFDAYLNRSVKEVQQSQERYEAKDIGYAVRMIKKGYKVKRANWQDRFITLKETIIDGDYEVKDVIYIIANGKNATPWMPNMYDLFATNWEVTE